MKPSKQVGTNEGDTKGQQRQTIKFTYSLYLGILLDLFCYLLQKSRSHIFRHIFICIANVGDGGRDSYPIHWNERLMRDTYLPPFEACFKRGGSKSVMTSYNSYYGSPSTSNDWLLHTLLKKEWGFDGFVISDAGATGGANVLDFTAKDYADATTKSITNGLDVIFQTSIDLEHLSMYDQDIHNVVEPEDFRIMIGSLSQDIRLRA